MSKLNAHIEFAPDGKHYQIIKRAKDTMKLWNYFHFNKEIRAQLNINIFAKFRLVGASGVIVAVLPKPKTKEKFMKEYFPNDINATRH